MKKQLLIIPSLFEIEKSQALLEEYSVGYEYNEFFVPSVLDNADKCKEISQEYRKFALPSFSTLHGAFFDVIPCSPDQRVAEISALRIEQSISAARLMGARGVVFHTNYNPFLNSPQYISDWIIKNADYWRGVLKANSDVEIWLENMFDTSPDIMEKLAQRLCDADNFGLCLDWAHASLSQTAAPVWAERLGKYVRHIHINDNDLKSDLHLPWGNGRIDRKAFYECYDKYLDGASVLIETSSAAAQKTSLETLELDGFLN